MKHAEYSLSNKVSTKWPKLHIKDIINMKCVLVCIDYIKIRLKKGIINTNSQLKKVCNFNIVLHGSTFSVWEKEQTEKY